MTRIFRQAIATAILFALAVLTLPVQAVAQDTTQAANETVTSTHGDWEVVCSTAQPTNCVMRQFGKNAEGNNVMDVRIRKLAGVTSQDGKTFPAAIQITTPLGTNLRGGVQVKIDGGEPRTGIFEVCFPAGCIIREPMSEEFLSEMKAGKSANMVFNALQRGTLNVVISLSGFTKAFNKL